MKTTPYHPFTVPLMAISAGVTVANIYYNQPILNDISAATGATAGEAGRVSTLAQLGYGLGMFFVVPLGDKLDRRKLITGLTSLLFFSLLLLSFARSIQLICLLSFFVGIGSTPAQILLPMSATISTGDRGKTVGRVFAGILIGILGARVVAGAVSDLLGWRYVFAISALLVLIVTVLLYRYLPVIPPKFQGSYPQLLSSTVKLIGEYSVLRQAALLGAFTFGTFCSFWTTLTFHLSAAPLHYSASRIGLFGLIAIGGALAAPLFGKLADKGQVYKSLFLTVSMVIVSILLLKIFPHSILLLSVSIFLLDVGVQATQITNFTRIYSLHEHAHSRLNTVYMTAYFMGAALGTSCGVAAWQYGGWDMATWQLLLWSIIALVIVGWSARAQSRAVPAEQ
ncbi:MFS transporter [Chitinophaga sp. 22536]|uniref:MFS transporter n=1 Tax=unclassified Chitinophaga TaxID=2619133 RepID=UPI003F82DCD3